MLRARPLTNSEFEAEARPRLEQIYASLDPFGTPLAPAVSGRSLIYPVDGYYSLAASEFAALADAASSEEDLAFYLAPTEGRETVEFSMAGLDGTLVPFDPQLANIAQDWWIPFDEWESYATLKPALENVVFSPRGTWGLLFSQEDYAIVGGTMSFVEALTDRWPSEAIGLPAARVFAEDMQTLAASLNTRYEWLPLLLDHIFGQAAAQDLLAPG